MGATATTDGLVCGIFASSVEAAIGESMKHAEAGEWKQLVRQFARDGSGQATG